MFRFLFKLILVAIIVVAAFLAYGLLLPIGPHSQQLVQLKPIGSSPQAAKRCVSASSDPLAGRGPSGRRERSELT